MQQQLDSERPFLETGEERAKQQRKQTEEEPTKQQKKPTPLLEAQLAFSPRAGWQERPLPEPLSASARQPQNWS